MHRKFSFRNEIQRKSIFTGPFEDVTDMEGGDSLNLALQNIREVPRKHISKAIVGSVRTLDLSYNKFEYPFRFDYAINFSLDFSGLLMCFHFTYLHR